MPSQPDLGTVEHPGAGFTIAVPSQWRVERDTNGCAVMAVEGPRPDGVFAANLNVLVEETGEQDLQRLADQHLAGIAAVLADHRLIDVEEVTLGGMRALRSLSLHRFGPHSLALEQWIVPAGGRTFTISATAEAVDYVALRALFSAMAAAFKAGSPS